MSAPLRQFVLKVVSGCDLACDYCYVYTKVDQRWRSRPSRMSRETMDAASARIAEHARRHGLRSVDVVLHGGEPLLAPVADLRHLVETLRADTGPDVRVDIGVQTNGVRLRPALLETLAELDVHVSVSLDGDRAAHDRHRRTRSGHGAHAAVEAGLRHLTGDAYRHLFAGLVCVVDPANDPVATYEALARFAPPAIDFLLPHANWGAPPSELPGKATPYGSWLGTVFDRWYDAEPPETSVRLFEETIAVLLGGHSRVEGVGLGTASHVVVETDGSLELSDFLTDAYEGASATSLHVARDAFDAVLALPEFAFRQAGVAGLAEDCRKCSIVRSCGGGLYAHRYRPGSGFRNPSVYCADIYRFMSHVRERLASDLAAIHRRAR